MKNLTIWCLISILTVTIAEPTKGEPVRARESRFMTYDTRTKEEIAYAKLSPQARFAKKIKDLQKQNLKLKKQVRLQNKVILQLKTLLNRNNILIPKKLNNYTPPKVGFIDNGDGITSSFKFPLTIGQKAYFGSNRSVNVFQVIDDKNFLAKLFYLSSGRKAPDYTTETVWIKGIDTKNFVDGSGAKINVPLEVTGTQKYETALGSNSTVYLLQPIVNSIKE